MATHWYRLAIDIDQAGNPLGCSYEVMVGRTTKAIHVLEAPGPFEDLADVLQRLMDDTRERYGVQGVLFRVGLHRG